MKRFLLCCSCLAFIAPFFFLNGCFLFHDSSPKETLPPATQTGANTFGCYVNGKLWLPKGYNGTSNFSLSYDPKFMGAFNIETYRSENETTQYILIGSDSIYGESTYYLSPQGRVVTLFSYFNNTTQKAIGCDYTDTTTFKQSGRLTITRLDLQKGIISGTFQFTLVKLGCDTIKITEGRFDKKL